MIIDKSKELVTLYQAYGYTASGVVATYRWTYDGSNREEDCITRLCIIDLDGKELYNKCLGNNVIFLDVFKRNIDNILWYLSQKDTKIDELTLEHDIIQKVLIQNSSMFSYRINNRKQHEKEQQILQQEQKKREEHENKLTQEIIEYCNSKNLYYINDCTQITVLQLKSDIRHILESASNDTMRSYIKFAQDHDNNIKEFTIVYTGNTYTGLDAVLQDIKAIKIKKSKMISK